MLPSQKRERSPGFNCPKCNFFIEMTIESLLYESTQTCPGCTTVFSMDRTQSKEALQLIQRLHVAMKNIETVKKFDGKR